MWRLLTLGVLAPGAAFYLPGLAPTEYMEGEQIDLKVNKLTSVKTQLPYGYYSLPFCKPPEGVKGKRENLGEQLAGDKIENSPYEIRMAVNLSCVELCQVTLDGPSKEKFRSKIEDEYVVNWLMDNLPAATKVMTMGGGSYSYSDGFPVGYRKNGRYYVHNHLRLDLKYHQNPEVYEGYRLVGFEVESYSAAPVNKEPVCASGAQVTSVAAHDLDANDIIIFSYDVIWTESPIRWASRWDSYLKIKNNKIHWFALCNSALVMLFLAGMVGMILLRTLARDIAQYNEISAEDAKEESGWKLVHGDVFRKPEYSRWLCVSVGTGMQMLCMAVVTLFFAILGFLSPANRGGLLQCMMFLYTLMGVVAGYVAARLCKLFDGDEARWKTTTLLTAFFYPGIFFGIFFVLDLFIWGKKSSGAVPFGTMFVLLVLWFGVSVPLVFFGAYAGFRQPVPELPVRTNQIPRAVPPPISWHLDPRVLATCGGLLPFGTIFAELYVIMSSLWLHQFYYVFGFLALILVIELVTCTLTSIAMTYFCLCTEDYNWWWISFWASGSSGLYVFIYSFFYIGNLQLESYVGGLLYFGYMAMASIVYSLLTGSVGMISTFFFVKAIYGSIKVD